MKTQILLLIILGIFISSDAQSQSKDIPEKKHYIGSSLFMLFNLSDDPPKFYQLNYGYRLTRKDELSIEAITWTYKGPLGRQYGPDFDNPDSEFPGMVQAFGAGLAYKRFLWKGLFAQAHATAFHQNYLDENNDKIQSGFQLFCVARTGWHFNLFKNRAFIEPSVAFTSWPINTNLPDSFQEEEDKWGKIFFFEPGLHFGINF